MKKLFVLIFLFSPLIGVSQTASRGLPIQMINPLAVSKPLLVLCDTSLVGNFRFYTTLPDSIKWSWYNVRWVSDSMNARTDLAGWGLTKSAQTFAVDQSLVMSVQTANDSISALKAIISTKQPQINGTGFVKASGTAISYDNSTYLTSVPAQSFASLTGKPTTLSGYGITDGVTTSTLNNYLLKSDTTGKWLAANTSYLKPSDTASLSNRINLKLNIADTTGKWVSLSQSRAGLSLTTTGTGAATYNPSTGAFNIPTPPAVYVPTINNVTRPVNSTTFTPSTTLQATVTYYIQISCTATIGSASSGMVVLQYSTNGGSSYIDAGTVRNSNTVTLAVALNSVTIQTAGITAAIPANALVRLVPTTTGTTTITYISGQEVY